MSLQQSNGVTAVTEKTSSYVSIHDGAVIYSSAEHSLKKKTNKQKNRVCRSGQGDQGPIVSQQFVCQRTKRATTYMFTVQHGGAGTRRITSPDVTLFCLSLPPVAAAVLFFFRLQQEINMSRPLPGATKPKAKHVRTISRDYQRGV